MRNGNVVVIGSINMDVINRVNHHPAPGETIHSNNETQYSPGGKGANQAVSASLSGSPVTMLGAVGDDAFGGALIRSLQGYGVDVSSVRTEAGASGLAFITVDSDGENTIILSAGANGKVTPTYLNDELLRGAKAILLQNEIPPGTNESIMLKCKENNVPVYYNPAPARVLEERLYSLIDTIILNETEATLISGIEVKDRESAERSAADLIHKGIANVIITLGAKGALYKSAELTENVTAFNVKAVDTTAAGDTFIGAYTASKASGATVKESLVFAAAASAIAVTREGAQKSIPRKDETEAFLIANR